MSLTESGFHALAEKTLNRILEVVEDRLPDDVEAEMASGVLTLDVEGAGQYVLNKNAPMRQLWLSSPRSGAHHFAYDEGRKCWLSTRADLALEPLLADELTAITGVALDFAG